MEISQHDLDDPIAALIATHPGIGAVLIDGSGHLKATYATIQSAIDAAIEGDAVIVAPNRYAENLRIDQPLTLGRAQVDRAAERAGVKAIITGRVVVAASAMNVTLDGIAIDGPLEMESIVGATASVTLRNCRIEGRHATSAIQGTGVASAALPCGVTPLSPGRTAPLHGP